MRPRICRYCSGYACVVLRAQKETIRYCLSHWLWVKQGWPDLPTQRRRQVARAES